MQFLILILLICFFIFLFALYLLTRDDFVLIRKDVSLEKVFNMAFVTFAASILGARILYVILNPSLDFLNPLVFLLFPYYPGLSLVGGVVGGVLFLLTFGKYQKLPMGRLLDFFSISFLSSFPFAILGYFLLAKVNILTFKPVILFLVHIVILILFFKFLLPRLLGGKFRDGTIGLIFLIFFAVISLVGNFIGRVDNLLNLGLEDLILIIMLYASLVFLFRQERLITKVKKLNLKTITKFSKR